MSLVPQAVGLLATLASVSSVALTCERRLRLMAGAGQFVWMIHFWLIDAPTTAAVAALMCARQLSSAPVVDCTDRARGAITLGFYAAFSVAVALTWQGLWSLLPWSIAMLCNYGYANLTGLQLRKLLRVVDGLGLTNAIALGSFGGVLTATLAIALNTMTLCRLEASARPGAGTNQPSASTGANPPPVVRKFVVWPR